MKYRKGQSLIEVTVAILIAAITATGMFSVILSTKYSYAKADARESAAIVLHSAQEYLKPYVSVAGTMTGEYLTNFMPKGKNIYGESGWALADGTHDLTFLLAKMPQLGGATLTYTVSTANCNNQKNDQNLECRKVSFSLTIPE